MKKKLLKRLTSIATAICMTAAMVIGMGVTVYAASHPDWPTEVHTDCSHPGEVHFYATGGTCTTSDGYVGAEGRLFTPDDSPEDFDEDAEGF